MKCAFALLFMVGAVSPIEKTMQLLDGLIAKITKEGLPLIFTSSAIPKPSKRLEITCHFIEI